MNQGTKIKRECKKMYAQIKSAEERLVELRAECKHEETFEGLYQWRVASILPAVICKSCGSVIRSLP